MRRRLLVLGLAFSALAWLSPVEDTEAQVARDANSSSPSENSGLTHNHTGKITVGGGANRALIVQFVTEADPGTVTVTWDPAGTNQTVAQIASVSAASGRYAQLYGLVAPTSGNLDVKITTSNEIASIINATSYTGVDQTGGTTSFPGAATNTGTSTTVSVTITSAAGDMTVDSFTAPVGSATPTQTQLFFLSGVGAVDGGASEAAGAASNTHEWTIANEQWGSVGTNIKASGAAPAVAPAPPQRLLLGVGT